MKLIKAHTSQTSARKWRSRYECRCGAHFEAIDAQVRSGHTTSCGCYGRSRGVANGKASARHNAVGTLTYKCWSAMRARCFCASNGQYRKYGAKGITADPRWDDFNAFLADMGERPSAAHTLGRIDHSKGYAPGNVRWETRSDNTREANKRRYERAA